MAVANLSVGRFRLAATLLTVALPLVAAATFCFSELAATLHQHRTALLDGALRQAETRVLDRLDKAGSIVTLLALDPTLAPAHPAGCRERLLAVAKSDPAFANIWIANLLGYEIGCSTLDTRPGVGIDDREFFRQALSRPDLAIGKPRIGRSSRRPVIVLAIRLLDAQGVPNAVLNVAVDVLQVIDEVRGGLATPETAFTLWTADALLLARSPDPEGLTGQHLPDAETFQRATATASGEGSMVATAVDGVRCLFAFRKTRIGDHELILMAGMREDGLLVPIGEALIVAGLSVLLGGLLSLRSAMRLLPAEPLGRPIEGGLSGR